jgi:hypothetical protein
MSGSLKVVPIDLVKDLSGVIEDVIKKNFSSYEVHFLTDSTKSKKKFTNYL